MLHCKTVLAYSVCQDGALICQNNGVCVNNVTCLCYPGYTGEDCSSGRLKFFSICCILTTIPENHINSFASSFITTLIYFWCIADILCDPISSILMNEQMLQNQGNGYGALVTYTCRYGFQMSDAAESGVPTVKTVFCGEDGNWGPNFATCLRMFNFVCLLN